ncbi:MAG: radical SAM protein [Lachnospiraceae bacterium]|nr:radical SAM protein [Lachnospiraceae bacterium]
MKAEKGIYPKNRQVLAEVLPVDTPFLVDFHISNVCNFKCEYCVNSCSQDVYAQTGLIREFMTMDTFKLAVDQLKAFPKKIKQTSLDGIGEPLLNKNLPEMIKYLKESDVSENIIVLTNASRLTHELSEQLVEAGLQELRISLQGLTAEQYYITSKAKIVWDDFYENIKYFSTIKKDCKLKVKIADVALHEGERELFYKLFGDICDAVDIEHIYEAFSNIGKVYDMEFVDVNQTRYGLEMKKINTCWYPFIRMDMRSDGTFANCCNALFGFEKNIREESIYDQWNGAAMNKMRMDFLTHQTQEYGPCQKCHLPEGEYHPEDVLDGHESEIIQRMKIMYGLK